MEAASVWARATTSASKTFRAEGRPSQQLCFWSASGSFYSGFGAAGTFYYPDLDLNGFHSTLRKTACLLWRRLTLYCVNEIANVQ
jgi:hypothetical protein